MTRVFIGIPTINRPGLVCEAIGSVLGQTFQDFRIVVSDNASAPAAIAGLEEHIRRLGDPRIRLHVQPHNVQEYGQCVSLFKSCGDEEYFLILHDDDVLRPRYLETAVACLDRHPEACTFVAAPDLMDAGGTIDPGMTEAYLREHGRTGRAEGLLDMLEPVLEHGLPPVSGTLMRTSALRESGFVDEGCFGLYPFELNLFLRLAERGGRAWLTPEHLLAFRFHGGSMRVYINHWTNPHVVGTIRLLLERRRFRGRAERLRRGLLGFMNRCEARIRYWRKDLPGCRAAALRSVAVNPFAWRNWASAAAALVAPRFLPRIGEPGRARALTSMGRAPTQAPDPGGRKSPRPS